MNANLKLVILDRDGTINRTGDEFVKSPQAWEPLPGALEAISRLNHAGFHVVLATNESGLGRGLFDMAAFNEVHSHLIKKLAAVGFQILGIGGDSAALDQPETVGHQRQQVHVVADKDHRAGIFGQRLDQRLAAFHVEVVGRLVEDQEVRRVDGGQEQ